MPSSVLLRVVVCGSLGGSLIGLVAGRDASAQERPPSPLQEKVVSLPMRFERNSGRVRHDVDFVARGAGYTVYLAADAATLDLGDAGIALRLIGARRGIAATGDAELPGRTNHIAGRDRDDWRMGIRAYARVEYRGVYRGIDVAYYGAQRQLEYDFVVAPGADYRQIRLAFDGATHLSLDESGNLVIGTSSTPIVQLAPVIYQNVAGTRKVVDGGYTIGRDGKVSFRIGRYNRRLPLVIDPVIAYSTYLGGTNGEAAEAVTTDANGNIYVVGQTWSIDFPTVNAAQPAYGGPTDAFIAKLNAAGDTLVYATYFGGRWSEWATDVAVDTSGNAYLYGTTFSPDFPVAAAIQSTLRGPSDAFAAKFDSTGALVYSTLLGGGEQEFAFGIALDAAGRAYLSGWTGSPDFPTVNPLQATLGGTVAFRSTTGGGSWTPIASGLRTTWVRALVIDPDNRTTIYAATYGNGVFKTTDGGSTWLPASNGIEPPYVYSLAIDSVGSLYAATDFGVYRSDDGAANWTATNLNTGGLVTSVVVDPSAAGTVYAGVMPGFNSLGVYKTVDGGLTWADTGLADAIQVLAISASSPSTLYAASSNGVYRTTNGGGEWTHVREGLDAYFVMSLAVDPADPLVVYAATESGVFKTTSGGDVWAPVEGFGGTVPFSVAFAPSSPSTIYVGLDRGVVVSQDGGETWASAGLNETTVWSFAVDPLDAMTVYVASMASLDGYVARLSADGSALEFSTYFGGSSFDSINGVTVRGDDIYLLGATSSTDLPVHNAIQPAFGGVRDVFVTKLDASGAIAYSTYIGGAGTEDGESIVLDAEGNVYVAGYTLSLDFPLVAPQQPAFGGGFADAFVTKLNASGSAFVYSTFLGGSGFENDVVLDVTPWGEAVVAGTTFSTNFPTLHPVNAAHSGGFIDVFVASYDSAGALQYSTYLGGSGRDAARGIAVDATGDALVVGSTESVNFPTKDPLQAAKLGPVDTFITRLSPGVADTTPPAISITSPESIDYAHVEQLTLAYSAVDEGSGLASVSATLDGVAVANDQTVQLLTLSLGTHTLVVTASDAAGNTATQSVSFTVVATLDSLIATVTLFTADGRVDAHTARSLLAKLNEAKQAQDRGNLIAARNKLREFIDAVTAHSGRAIEAGAARLLVADATYVLDRL